MKKISILSVLMLLCAVEIFAQHQITLIDNKGNRLQTYPNVTEINPEIAAMLEQVNKENLEESIRWMQDLGVRAAESQEAVMTQDWLVEKFESFGLDTYIHYFTLDMGTSIDTLQAGNVYAIQYGTAYPDEIIIISAHYDHHAGPGADDNASGTAGVVECARILSQYQFDRTIMYIPFNAEEYQMTGSMPFVERCAMENMDILGVFNLDMLGFFPEDQGPLTMSSGYSPISERLWNHYYTVANLYVPEIPTLRFSDGDSDGGDHVPFNIYEYPALYIGDIEYLHLHPCYHEPCDTIGHGVNNFDLVEGFVKATMASVAELADGWLAPQDFSAIPGDSQVYLSWNEAPETSVYKVFKNNVLILETTDNFYIDTDVENGITYEYFVKGVNENTNEESAESNHDMAKPSLPLPYPYFNDFEDNFDEFTTTSTHQQWHLSDSDFYSGNKSLCNSTKEEIPYDYLSIAELQWFSIPDTVQDISISFYYIGDMSKVRIYHTNLFFEVTTDRKTWHKLGVKSWGNNSWIKCEFSLNDFIGSPFVQFRFRFESSGESTFSSEKRIFIDDLKIAHPSSDLDIQEHKFESLKLSDICIAPNPSSGNIEIVTGLTDSYKISIYNQIGQRICTIDDFNDGKLDVSFLEKGVYYLQIITNHDSVAKKIVIQ